jgi:hypothetical protein
MSEQKNIFTNLRDKHGVADLLREVSKRKSALTPKHRREVNDIADRVDGGTESVETSDETLEENIADDNDASDKPTVPVNRWGNNFFQKFTNKQAPQNPLKANDEQPNDQNKPREFFRNFSIQRIQNPLKPKHQQQQEGEEAPANGGNNDRRQEIRKSLERSQQQSKEMLQKFSTNFQNNFQNLSNNVRTSLKIPTNVEKAAEVSETLRALDQASNHSRSDVKL